MWGFEYLEKKFTALQFLTRNVLLKKRISLLHINVYWCLDEAVLCSSIEEEAGQNMEEDSSRSSAEVSRCNRHVVRLLVSVESQLI